MHHARILSSWAVLGLMLLLGGTMLTSRYSYLLFHSLAEFFSILIAWSLAILAWHARRYMKNDTLLILGIAAFFAGALDLVHTLAYKGMNIFIGYDANLPTQLWIAARYLQSVSLLFVAVRNLVPPERRHPVNPIVVLASYTAITTCFMGAIFGGVFPICYIEGAGLTSFKIISEYLISAMLALAMVLLWRGRDRFDRSVLNLLLSSIVMMIAAELAFTFYLGVYDLSNLLGHSAKIISFYLLYRAVIVTGLDQPYALLFRELKESEKRFKAFMEHLPGVALMKDDSGRYVYLNDRFAALFKLDAKDWFGKTDRELAVFPRDVVEQLAANDRKVLTAGVSLETIETVPIAGDTRRWLTVKFPLTVPQNAPGLLAGISIDITDRLRAEEERLRLERQVQQIQKVESLGRMAGAIAHHFNNLLGVIMGNLELAVADPILPGNRHRHLTDAMTAATRAAEISHLMLAYLGQSVGQREPIVLSTVCRETLPLITASLPLKMRLRSDLPDEGPIVRADAVQIRQILSNLVVNAAEAMEHAEGELLVSVRVMPAADIRQLHLHPPDWQPREEEYACLAVSDTGSGISLESLEKLFDPFFSTKFTGRGLGLSVVLGLVKAHEGAVAVGSSPGQGSIFQVFLPLWTGEPPHSGKRLPASSVLPEAARLVLLVDDNPAFRKMAETMLEVLGYEVITAGDGDEALRIFREHQSGIGLVLLDLTMPHMGGWETLAALRALRADLPVILASGCHESQVMAGNHPERAQAFLHKPWQMAELKAAIEAALRG